MAECFAVSFRLFVRFSIFSISIVAASSWRHNIAQVQANALTVGRGNANDTFHNSVNDGRSVDFTSGVHHNVSSDIAHFNSSVTEVNEVLLMDNTKVDENNAQRSPHPINVLMAGRGNNGHSVRSDSGNSSETHGAASILYDSPYPEANDTKSAATSRLAKVLPLGQRQRSEDALSRSRHASILALSQSSVVRHIVNLLDTSIGPGMFPSCRQSCWIYGICIGLVAGWCICCCLMPTLQQGPSGAADDGHHGAVGKLVNMAPKRHLKLKLPARLGPLGHSSEKAEPCPHPSSTESFTLGVHTKKQLIKEKATKYFAKNKPAAEDD